MKRVAHVGGSIGLGMSLALAGCVMPAAEDQGQSQSPVYAPAQPVYAPAPQQPVYAPPQQATYGEPGQPVYPNVQPPPYYPPADDSQPPPEPDQQYPYAAAPPPDYASADYAEQEAVSAPEPPPPLPIYDQPECPAPGYLWTPGYWDYSPSGYYWVPGTWALPPQPGLLWTPGYWEYGGNSYVFHRGYWGPHVGYYGGIRYGHGYEGYGYEGGHWEGRDFHYNSSVNRVNVMRVHNVYNAPVPDRGPPNGVSFNGGSGGTQSRPYPGELGAFREHHYGPTSVQFQHQMGARGVPGAFASQNHGAPPLPATPYAGGFNARPAAPAGGAMQATPRPVAPNGQGSPGGWSRSYPNAGQPRRGPWQGSAPPQPQGPGNSFWQRIVQPSASQPQQQQQEGQGSRPYQPPQAPVLPQQGNAGRGLQPQQPANSWNRGYANTPVPPGPQHSTQQPAVTPQAPTFQPQQAPQGPRAVFHVPTPPPQAPTFQPQQAPQGPRAVFHVPAPPLQAPDPRHHPGQ